MRNELTASRLFRTFPDMAVPTGDMEGIWHGFWGRLTGSDADLECLNTGDGDAACILVDKKIRNAVYGTMEDHSPKRCRSILPRIR